jgi:hypothetical protein
VPEAEGRHRVRRRLAQRWNGYRWRTVPVPSGSPFRAAAALGPTSVWTTTSDFELLRWNGRRWRAVSPRPITNASGGLGGIAAISDRNVWVVGAFGIEHHDGQRWTKKVHPSQQFVALDAVSRDDIWAVGSRYVSGAGWQGVVRRYSCS